MSAFAILCYAQPTNLHEWNFPDFVGRMCLTRTSRNRLHSKARERDGFPLLLSRPYDWFQPSTLGFDAERLLAATVKQLEICTHRADNYRAMKSLFVSIVGGFLLVGCGKAPQSPEVLPTEPIAEAPAQPSSPPTEAKPVELIAEVPPQNVKPANPKADRALIDAAQSGNIEAAKQAIADGADVDTLDKRGRAPIQNALHSGNIEAVKLLIDNGANLNAKAANSWTPLYEAILIGRMETVKLLLENGANVNARDQMGETPLDQIQNKEIIDFLRLHGGKTGRELKAEGK